MVDDDAAFERQLVDVAVGQALALPIQVDQSVDPLRAC